MDNDRRRPGDRPGLRPGERPISRPGERPASRPGERPVPRSGERPALRPGQRSGARPGTRQRPRLVVRKKKEDIRFKLGFLIYILLLLFAILVVDIVVWGKLSAYEKSENKKSATKVVDSSGKVVKIVTEKPAPTREPSPTLSPTPTSVPTEEIILRAPENSKVFADDVLLTAVSSKEYSDGRFDTLMPFIENYSEYAVIKNIVEFPKMNESVFAVPVGAKLSITDSNGNAITPEEKTEDGKKVYSVSLVSNDANKEAVTTRAFEFLVHYSLFCAGDETTSPLIQYFPKGSEYLKLIKKTDNGWYNRHRGLPTYKNKTVNEFFGYGDSLCYMDLSMVQTILASANGKYLDYDINMGIWMCKMDGTWMVAGMVYKEM